MGKAACFLDAREGDGTKGIGKAAGPGCVKIPFRRSGSGLQKQRECVV